MDILEAFNRLMSRIKDLEPENATKTLGYILIQISGDNEMMMLANCPDDLLLSVINQAKANANRISNQFPQTSPRISMPNINASNFPINSPRPVPNYGVVLDSPGQLRSHGAGGRRIGEQKLCMFFALGSCNNGGDCKFSHGDFDGFTFTASVRDELMRMKERLALMNDDEFVRFLDENQRKVFLNMGPNDAEESQSTRRIYLTFRPGSTVKEEEVDAYFSAFGPVSDVRIPFQEKRMFGFVTFVNPETVKLVLDKTGRHCVGGSHVHVKRYKTKRQRMEEEILQHTLEQRRRIMNLQRTGLRNEHHNLPFQPPRLRISSPRQPQFGMIQNVSSDATNQGFLQDGQRASYSAPVAFDSSIYNHIDSGNNQRHLNDDDSDIPESLERLVLDDLLDSPKNVHGEGQSFFTTANTSMPPSSYSQRTRQEAFQMCKKESD